MEYKKQPDEHVHDDIYFPQKRTPMWYFTGFSLLNMCALRIPAIHGVKTTKNHTPGCILLDYFTTRPSFKNLYDPFLTQWPEMLKCVSIWKVPCGGRAKNKNVTDWSIFYVFNVGSATRGHYSNVNTFLTSLATWSKKGQNFERRSGCKTIKQHVPGGVIFSGFSTMYSRYPYTC